MLSVLGRQRCLSEEEGTRSRSFTATPKEEGDLWLLHMQMETRTAKLEHDTEVHITEVSKHLLVSKYLAALTGLHRVSPSDNTTTLARRAASTSPLSPASRLSPSEPTATLARRVASTSLLSLGSRVSPSENTTLLAWRAASTSP